MKMLAIQKFYVNTSKQKIANLVKKYYSKEDLMGLLIENNEFMKDNKLNDVPGEENVSSYSIDPNKKIV